MLNPGAMDPQIVPQPSITGLIKELLTDVQTLIREEIALARLEMKEQAGRARAAAMSFGIAAAALAFGVTFLLIAVATAIAGTDATVTTTETKKTQALLDRAATKGYIHPNKAARLKSRLVKATRAAAKKPAAPAAK